MGKGKGGGGGGGTTQSTATSYQTNVPEYARPYVESMLGATQKQLFTTQPTEGGGTEITGFQPYRAYGGTYDESGKMTGYDPSKAVAGFQPLQTTAQQGIAGLQVPGQFADASQAAAQATQAALGAGQYQPGYFGNQFRAPPSYQPSQFSMLQAQAPELQQYQMGPAQQVQGGIYGAPMMETAQTGYQPDLQTFQMGPAERVRTGSFLQPGTSQAYMSPYMQDVVAQQQKEAIRQSDILGTQQAGEAVRSGAFGGSRAGLLEAERQRNLGTQLGNIQAQGLQSAYQQAQQQYNTEQQARMQAALANQQAGLTVGGQNLAAALGVQQLGTQTGLQTSLANLSAQQQANVQNQAAQLQAQGLTANQAMQAALANQQAGLTVGGQNLAAQLGVQQLGAGQNLQAQLANQQAMQAAQQAAEQSRQYGYGQAMTAAQQRAQYGLAGQQAAEQSRQFGANLGLQGAQTGLQGAGTMAGIGAQQLGAQQGIYGLQAQTGAQQQALEQQKINQAIQDYANAQQYPLMQLGFMSNMLRGLPMQSVATQQYVAQPNYLTQGIGALGAGASIYNAFKGQKAGGVVKSMAAGGIASVPRYDVGGEVYADLLEMNPDQLRNTIKDSSSQRIKEMAKGILAEKMTQSMYGGGIVAFRKGGSDDEGELVADPIGRETGTVQDISPEGIASEPRSIRAPRPDSGPVNFDDQLEQYRFQFAPQAAQPAPAAPTVTAPAPAGITTIPGQGASAEGRAGEAEAQARLAALKAAAPVPVGPQAVQEAASQADLPDFLKAMQASATSGAGKTVQQIMQEQAAERKALGISDMTESRRQQREGLMAERANAEDEARRQRHLRLASLFAKWGTTPGSTIAAGLKAFDQSIEGIITDEKEYKKIKRDLDKSIADMDQADRLEKIGDYDAAAKIKRENAAKVEHVNELVYKYQLEQQKEKAQAEREAAKSRAEAKKQEEHDIRYAALQRELKAMEERTKKAVAEIQAGAREGVKADTLFNNAVNTQANVEARISNMMKSEPYREAVTMSQIDPKDKSEDMKKRIEAAKKYLTEATVTFDKLRTTADEAVGRARARVEGTEYTPPPTTPKPTPTPSPAGASGAPSTDREAAAAARLGLSNAPAAAPQSVAPNPAAATQPAAPSATSGLPTSVRPEVAQRWAAADVANEERAALERKAEADPEIMTLRRQISTEPNPIKVNQFRRDISALKKERYGL